MAVAVSAVRADDFAFTYAGQPSPVLANVTMDVPEGAFAVVCGSTGSGKTTLLKSMTGALAPAGKRSGLMEVFGLESPKTPMVGYVTQNPEAQIVCDTVLRELAFGLENLGVDPDTMRRRIAEVATVFGIGSLVDAKTADLSGGQKQLVSLAATIAMRPRLLLLDEPTAQLDPISARQLCDVLRMANRQLGITVLIATHSPELFADMASCAFELREGGVSQIEIASLRFEQKGAPPFGSNNAGRNREEGNDETVIRLRDAWFSYERNSPWVLKGIDGSFRPGEVSCIVGGNGSGKTTLLKAIAGILKPQRGKVGNGLIGSQAYLPQDPRLLFTADTVAEEIADDKDDKGVLLLSSFSSERALSPLDLSGGQQQMLALAKLLSASPKLLLLDEPVKGLDASSQMRLARLLWQIVGDGAAVIMTTHDIAFASRVADVVALMFDGRIASCASPREFFADMTYYKPRPNAFTMAWDAGCEEETIAASHE